MPNIGPMELIVVLAIALIILGPKKLPDAGRSVGRGMREFRKAISGGDAGEDHDGPLGALDAPAAAERPKTDSAA